MEIGESVAVPAAPAAPAKPAHTPGHLHLRSETVATAPSNRARTTIGVGEKVHLSAQGPTGTVNWSSSGSSKLSASSGASVTLTAHERAETVTITATDSCGCTATIAFTVIEPSSVRMERVPGTGIFHDHGIPSVGIRTNIYLAPDTVSFENISVSEDDCVGVVTGYLVGTPLDGVHHAGHGAGHWVSVRPPVAGKGSQVNGRDTAASGHCNFGTPYAWGTFDWPIPWLFRVGGGASKQFTTVHQRFTINAAGDMTVSKAGASGSAALNDPSSTY